MGFNNLPKRAFQQRQLIREPAFFPLILTASGVRGGFSGEVGLRVFPRALSLVPPAPGRARPGGMRLPPPGGMAYCRPEHPERPAPEMPESTLAGLSGFSLERTQSPVERRNSGVCSSIPCLLRNLSQVTYLAPGLRSPLCKMAIKK